MKRLLLTILLVCLLSVGASAQIKTYFTDLTISYYVEDSLDYKVSSANHVPGLIYVGKEYIRVQIEEGESYFYTIQDAHDFKNGRMYLCLYEDNPVRVSIFNDQPYIEILSRWDYSLSKFRIAFIFKMSDNH